MSRNVEQRDSPRLSVMLKGWIRIGSRLSVLTSTRNLSLHGALLNVAPGSLRGIRSFELVLADRRVPRHIHTRCIVIHSGPEGAGVLLRNTLPDDVLDDDDFSPLYDAAPGSSSHNTSGPINSSGQKTRPSRQDNVLHLVLSRPDEDSEMSND